MIFKGAQHAVPPYVFIFIASPLIGEAKYRKISLDLTSLKREVCRYLYDHFLPAGSFVVREDALLQDDNKTRILWRSYFAIRSDTFFDLSFRSSRRANDMSRERSE
jgi:hypothetical protein